MTDEQLQFSIDGDLKTPTYDCEGFTWRDDRYGDPFQELQRLHPMDGTPAEQLQTLIARLHSLQYARSRAFGDDPRMVRAVTPTVEAREIYNRMTVQIAMCEREIELVKARL